jgi:putative transposase
VERLQAFNYALQPNGEQARRMRRFAGSCRFVFNKALDIQQKRHEAGGKKVSQKSGLNRAILDQGWGEFRRQLDYKLAWCGGRLIAVPPHNTSRTCPACEHVSGDNRQTQAKFACVECGYENNADVVGAINVLERGQRFLACGEWAQSGRSAKQEPAEVS